MCEDNYWVTNILLILNTLPSVVDHLWSREGEAMRLILPCPAVLVVNRICQNTIPAICGRVRASGLTWSTHAGTRVIYKVYHARERSGKSVLSWLPGCSVVSLEWAGPGVGGGIVFPLSVSVSLALEFLLSDVFIGVLVGRFLLDGSSRGWSNEEG